MKKFIDKNCFWHNNKDKERVVKELEDLIEANTERCVKIVESYFKKDNALMRAMTIEIRDKQ